MKRILNDLQCNKRSCMYLLVLTIEILPKILSIIKCVLGIWKRLLRVVCDYIMKELRKTTNFNQWNLKWIFEVLKHHDIMQSFTSQIILYFQYYLKYHNTSSNFSYHCWNLHENVLINVIFKNKKLNKLIKKKLYTCDYKNRLSTKFYYVNTLLTGHE